MTTALGNRKLFLRFFVASQKEVNCPMYKIPRQSNIERATVNYIVKFKNYISSFFTIFYRDGEKSLIIVSNRSIVAIHNLTFHTPSRQGGLEEQAVTSHTHTIMRQRFAI